MKKVLLSLMLAGLLLASLATFVVAAPGGVTNPTILKELNQARQATRQYQNALLPTAVDWVSTAGLYVQTSPRVPGMGYHYANLGLVDGNFNVAAPEILIYEDAGNGRRLIAVEYVVTGASAPAGFTGSDDGWHWEGFLGAWTLHAWIWEGNPAGIFNPFNPNIP